MTQSIIMIGAGIAGLSAGCYARMNGYKTRIFEMHDKPGGLCTSWTRDGYTFDGCIEWLLGSHPGTDLHRMWQELGAVQGRRFINYDVFQRIEGSDGRDRAEAVISAADGLATIFDMLEGRYAGDKVRAAEP